MAKASKDYSKGKVYMIRSKDEDCVPYVGSTTKQYLSQRMDKHRSGYKQWKKNPEKYDFLSSFTLFEKFGIQNCFIELIELFPCKCNDELRKKEREWFNKLNCVNIDRPFVTKEESLERIKKWIQNNPEKRKETQKIYTQIHKEEYKEYVENHKEHIAEYKSNYYQKNKEEISEKGKETYECPCGSICRKVAKARHERSKKHQEYLTKLTVCVPAIA
jgi:hypothetical protein